MTDIKHPEITVQLAGKDGNAFYILGICERAMKRHHLMQNEIDQFMKEAMYGDYNHLLATTMAWFDVE